MDGSAKYCIINAAIGSWYPKGQERLKRSLIYHGFTGDLFTWLDWPNENYDKSCPYNVKAAAFEEAFNMGYTHILWLDSSVWALSNPDKMFDLINEKGYYIGDSTGYNVAQTCNDKCLDYFKVTRDEAEKITDCASGILGLNVSNPIARSFYFKWIEAAKDGAFAGSRLHDNQSKDPRFLCHRQDQSAASLIANELGMKLTPFGEQVAYYENQINDKTIFTLRGM